jgi:hypothetical protein
MEWTRFSSLAKLVYFKRTVFLGRSFLLGWQVTSKIVASNEEYLYRMKSISTCLSVEAFRATTHDLIFVSVSVPSINDFTPLGRLIIELLKRIKASSLYQHIPLQSSPYNL